jgi:hypothetical protein
MNIRKHHDPTKPERPAVRSSGLGHSSRGITFDELCISAMVIRQHLHQGWLLWLAVLFLRVAAFVAGAILACSTSISNCARCWLAGRKAALRHQMNEEQVL